jgi:SAM-dependent methyltransferase
MSLKHEELYSNPPHYDLQAAKFIDDIPFYLLQVKKHGDPVLELGCGTGRITIPIAREGWKITGLDLNDAMLRRAREKATEAGVDIDWIQADFRNFKDDRQFKLIIFPFNSFLHLPDRESQEACLNCVKVHLSPDGRFILDIFNPDFGILTRDPDKRHFDYEHPDPGGGGSFVSTTKNSYDRASQINHVEHYLYYGKEHWTHYYEMRIIFPQELDSLLHYNGFVIEEKFGDYNESAFSSDSPRQIVVCRVMD